MTETLVRTKLNRPRLSRDIVHRSALVQRLNAGLERSLTLVVAPAGFGKTMLVAEWVSQASQRVAWLSLDEGDNDVVTWSAISLPRFGSCSRACPDTEALIHGARAKPDAGSVLTNEMTIFPIGLCWRWMTITLLRNRRCINYSISCWFTCRCNCISC
jgi:LuxR family maltose regulon positive regulatory protein